MKYKILMFCVSLLTIYSAYAVTKEDQDYTHSKSIKIERDEQTSSLGSLRLEELHDRAINIIKTLTQKSDETLFSELKKLFESKAEELAQKVWSGLQSKDEKNLFRQAWTKVYDIHMGQGVIDQPLESEFAYVTYNDVHIDEVLSRRPEYASNFVVLCFDYKQLETLLKDQRLISLTLSRRNNAMDDKVAENLAKILETNDKLCSLNISGHLIRDNGARTFGKMLEKNSTLRSLNLSQNQIGSSGIDSLLESLKKNSSLREIDLSDNKLLPKDKQKLEELAKNRSDLVIYY